MYCAQPYHACYENQYQIGGIRIKIVSDVELPINRNLLFQKFCCTSEKHDAVYFFHELENTSPGLIGLTSREKALLMQTMHFKKRWLINPALKSPLVRQAINRTQAVPWLSHISLAWNRLVIRNFNKNEFFYFYNPFNISDIYDPLFSARFRNLLGLSFVKKNSLMLHGAGAVTKKGAILFLAQDGGGKTTLIKKFPSKDILGDDQMVINFGDNSWYLHGTPFGTISCGPASSILKAIFIIKKSSYFRINPAPKNAALKLIWNEMFFRLMVYPNCLRKKSFHLAARLCYAIPSYVLNAPIDYLDFSEIERTIER